jgi:O-antigen ligase
MADSSLLESQQIIDNEASYVGYEDFSLEEFDEVSPRGRFFILCLLILPISLIPLTKSIYIPFIGNTVMDHRVFLVLMMGLLTMILKVTVWAKEPINPETKKWFLRPFLVLGVIQVISILWSESDSETRIYSLLSTLLLWSSVYAGVSLVSGMSYTRRHKMAMWLVLLLTGIMVVYILGSTRFAGLRPSAGFYRREELYAGIQRVGGPLAGATGLNLVLFPALGYSIGLVFFGNRFRFFWITASVILVATILLTGTLAAVITLLVMSILVMVVLRIKSILITMPVALLIGILILWVGMPERYLTKDILTRTGGRSESYRTALHAFSSSPPAILFGVGQGTLYRPPQVYRYFYDPDSDKIGRLTSYGFSLKGSHSTVLQPLAETGLIGFLFLAVILSWISWVFFARKFTRYRDPCTLQSRLALAGCVATFVLMVFDVVFFYNSWLTVIWAIFVIAAAETVEENRFMATQTTSAEEYEYI